LQIAAVRAIRSAHMKFSELPIGARFRFFSRGLLHAKKTSTTYAPDDGGSASPAQPDAQVIMEAPEPVASTNAKPQKKTAEEQARELLERIGVPNVRKFSSAALAELTALIERNKG
jgi:hypothetical protein